MKQSRHWWSGPLDCPPEQGFFGLLKVQEPAREDHVKMTRDGRRMKVNVTSAGDGVVSHAGSALLAQVADKTGLSPGFAIVGPVLRQIQLPIDQRPPTIGGVGRNTPT